MIELAAMGTQTDLDIAQALAVGELGEGYAQERIETGKGFDLVVAVVALLHIGGRCALACGR